MRAEMYRRYALDCLRFASEMSDPSGRLALLEMAQSWARLAEQAEKNSRADPIYPPPLRRPQPVQ
jgi:hypothetical protein